MSRGPFCVSVQDRVETGEADMRICGYYETIN